MKRQIKFRAWNNEEEHMYDNVQNFPDFFSFLYHEEYRIMQFTGLLDKNGKEIYEGDIFEGSFSSVYKVKWDDETCSWYVHDVTRGLGFPLRKIENLEIIGNIYENPELIEKRV